MIPEEGQTVERKESLSLWRDIVETCAAFATAQGGNVFVGVTDDGRISGVQIGKGTLEDLANRIAQNTTPRIVPAIRVGDLTKVFALPKRTLQRALQELTKKGLLIKNGTGKSTWYETTK